MQMDANVFGGNVDAIKKKTVTLIDASKEVGLKVNADKTKYVLLSRHQNAGQNNDLKRANLSFVTMAQFKYLGKAVTNQS
jgi:hypothetical protein